MNTKQSIRSNIVIFFLLLLSVNAQSQVAVWQIRPSYDSVDVLTENLLKVEKNGRYGLCDYQGNSVVDCLYDDFPHFKDGYTLLIQDGSAIGSVSISGKVTKFGNAYLLDMNYPYYSEGLLAVKNKGRWGYIDTEGNNVIGFKYRNALPFMKGLASVSDAEGNFMHINKSGRISLLGSGFNDDDLKFATSFITDDKGETFSIVVNSRWRAYKRDVNGKKMGSFELTDINVDTKQRIIKSGKYALYFDPAWRLLRLEVQGKAQKEYEINDDFYPRYLPEQSIFKSLKNTSGMYGVMVNDKICLVEQFESVLPLDRENVLVSSDGLYGLLKICLDEMIDVSLETQLFTMNHLAECGIKGSVHLPGSLSGKLIEVPSISFNEINVIIPDQSGTSFSFNYSPEDLKAGHRQKFQIKVKVDGLEYPPFNENVDFSHKSSFKISTPDKVSLDENGYCQFYVYITNLSDQKSDKCEVYVDGKLVKTQESFSGGQRIAASVTKRINMEDEDLKTMMLNIQVVEKGCPEYVDSKKVIFERYYANN